MSDTEPVHVEPGSSIVVHYDRERERRQISGMRLAAAILLATAAVGVWAIFAGIAQFSWPERIIPLIIGAFFIIVGTFSVSRGIVQMLRIQRLCRRDEPLIAVDQRGIRGITHLGGVGADNSGVIPWQDILGIHVQTTGPPVRRREAFADIELNARLRRETQRALDHTAQTRFGLQDGKRRIILDLAQQRRATLDLSFPLTPASFAQLTREVAEFVRHRNLSIPVDGVIER